MKKADLEGPDVDIVALINTGEKILDATLPFLTKLISDLSDLGQSDNIRTPRGKRIHIERLEAVDKLVLQKQELYDAYFEKLIAAGVLVP